MTIKTIVVKNEQVWKVEGKKVAPFQTLIDYFQEICPGFIKVTYLMYNRFEITYEDGNDY